jgi:hypothetical protein
MEMRKILQSKPGLPARSPSLHSALPNSLPKTLKKNYFPEKFVAMLAYLSLQSAGIALKQF